MWGRPPVCRFTEPLAPCPSGRRNAGPETRLTGRPEVCPTFRREQLQNRIAFTLIELLVVIAIIAILAAVSRQAGCARGVEGQAAAATAGGRGGHVEMAPELDGLSAQEIRLSGTGERTTCMSLTPPDPRAWVGAG